MKTIIICIGLLLALCINTNATTWFTANHTCPLCKNENTYRDIGSYGGYIYSWPSKFQYVYWPLTDFPSVYCCHDCHFSCYMWDFDSIPENKADSLKAYLTTTDLGGEYDDYLDIPMTKRLEIAEGVYRILGRDTEFWSQFYRIMGYHYDHLKEPDKAYSSRIKALELAQTMLTDTAYDGHEKEILYIIAAMYFYTGKSDSTMVYLDQARTCTYRDKNMSEEKQKGLNDYLIGLISQYPEFMKKPDEYDMYKR